MNYDEIKRLIDDMGNSKIDELNIEFPDGIKISMKKGKEGNILPDVQHGIPLPMIQTPTTNTNIINNSENVNVGKDEKKEEYKIVKSPMVGTFYSKPSPDAKPYVEIGQKVKKGDTLCIVEAMKLMNEIESEFDGEIVEICLKDGEMCDYGKSLFKIK